MFKNYMISKTHKSKEIFPKHKQLTGETLMTFRKKTLHCSNRGWCPRMTQKKKKTHIIQNQ